MRKIICLILAIAILALPLAASAVTPRTANISLSLSFSDTIANCIVIVASDDTTDEISCVLKLWRGSTCVATWTKDSTGYLYMTQSKPVISGVEYTLTADVVINGVAQPQVSTTKKCA